MLVFINSVWTSQNLEKNFGSPPVCGGVGPSPRLITYLQIPSK